MNPKALFLLAIGPSLSPDFQAVFFFLVWMELFCSGRSGLMKSPSYLSILNIEVEVLMMKGGVTYACQAMRLGVFSATQTRASRRADVADKGTMGETLVYLPISTPPMKV